MEDFNVDLMDKSLMYSVSHNILQKVSHSQVSPDSFPGKAFGAFLIDPFNTIKAFCKPRIKVGTEWVSEHYCEHYYQII